MSDYIEQRFEAYCGLITAEMEHADRRMPAQCCSFSAVSPVSDASGSSLQAQGASLRSSGLGGEGGFGFRQRSYIVIP